MFKIISKLSLLKISLIQDFLNYKLYFSFNLSSLYLKDIFENTSILIFDEIIFDVYICDDILFFISADSGCNSKYLNGMTWLPAIETVLFCELLCEEPPWWSSG